MIQTCPPENVLRQFNEGRLNDAAEIDRISEHLGLCEDCLDKLESMTPGPIANGLRQSLSNEFKAEDTSISDEESVRDSLDKAIAQVDSMIPDWIVETAELGENRFELIGSIGEGDFGCMFAALPQVDSSTVELVGIKIPHPHKLTSYRHCQQFFDDCQKAKSLKHSGILPVLEFGHWDERRLFLSKPLVQQPTLTKFAKNSPSLSHATMLSIFRQLVDIVQYAHRRNVIHRHLTPDNIHCIFEDCDDHSSQTTHGTPDVQVIVSDFGFFLDSRYHFDLVEPLGSQTPFISPECYTLNAKFIDARADVYSLGKILKLLIRITQDPCDEEGLGKIIEKSTYTRRRDRYQKVSELKSALEPT